MKSIAVHVLGVALTFVVSVLVVLGLKGILIAKPPFIAPLATQTVADSTAVPSRSALPAPEDAAPEHIDGPVGEPHSEYQRSPEDSLVLAFATKRPALVLPDTLSADQPAIEDMAPEPLPAAADPANVQRLARVYSKMKPKTVAQIMDSLSDENTLAILTTMNDRVAAKVIAGMDPTNAARLSEMMAKGVRQ